MWGKSRRRSSTGWLRVGGFPGTQCATSCSEAPLFCGRSRASPPYPVRGGNFSAHAFPRGRPACCRSWRRECPVASAVPSWCSCGGLCAMLSEGALNINISLSRLRCCVITQICLNCICVVTTTSLHFLFSTIAKASLSSFQIYGS